MLVKKKTMVNPSLVPFPSAARPVLRALSAEHHKVGPDKWRAGEMKKSIILTGKKDGKRSSSSSTPARARLLVRTDTAAVVPLI